MMQASSAGKITQNRGKLYRYFAIDGGSGAHLLEALTAQTPCLQPVAAPRHANLLIICEPISQKLASAIVAIAQSLPHPARVLIIHAGTQCTAPISYSNLSPDTGTGPSDERSALRPYTNDIFPHARNIAPDSVQDIVDAIFSSDPWPELTINDTGQMEPALIQLPAKQEQEMATELIVLSLGPVQPFTAGPLRMLLICDGEQVLSAQVETGFAERDIAGAMMKSTWRQSLSLARQLAPLAPIAGQLAFTRAVEQLHHWTPDDTLVSRREAALSLERTQNALWWLARFARILADPRLSQRAHRLASALENTSARVWKYSPLAWIAPQQHVPLAAIDYEIVPHLHTLAEEIEAITRQVERDRFLALRTRGIGIVSVDQLIATGVSGPVMQASALGSGDVQSRIIIRLQAAVRDIESAVGMLKVSPSQSMRSSIDERIEQWTVPKGEIHVVVEGPRGNIGLHLASDGGAQPSHIAWQRPSAALVSLLPELLAGQKLADAEIIVASLDVSMAEADG